MKKIAITGAAGFVGSALVREWRGRADILPVLRKADPRFPDARPVGDIGPDTDWQGVLSGIETIVHCAGRAHILNDKSERPLDEFRRVNSLGTLALARAAAGQGVRRLVFLSSVGVMGARSVSRPLRWDDPPVPVEDYAISKLEAEYGLEQVAQETGLETIMVRPPLVYGAEAPANFQRLVKLAATGLPLPLGRCTAPRSFVGIGNLADLLWACVHAPVPTAVPIFASDDDDISVADLVTRMRRLLGLPARLLPVPVPLLQFGARIVGRSADVDRLISPLRVDIAKTKELLSWVPKFSVDDELRRCMTNSRQPIGLRK
jgi:nucleoside-diphosphate-sugar epimerase